MLHALKCIISNSALMFITWWFSSIELSKDNTEIPPLVTEAVDQDEQAEEESSPDRSPVAPHVQSPEAVLQMHSHQLTDLERSEILEYPEVYFFGPDRGGMLGENDGGGGHYKPILHDHVAYRYKLLGVLGEGKFGKVLRAYDHKSRSEVALKIVRNERQFVRPTKDEINILERLNARDQEDRLNIVRLLEHFTFRGHICMAFEPLSINLYELSKRKHFAGLSVPFVASLARAILQCLKALKRMSIVHADLKPENILLRNERSGYNSVKVIDFGLSFDENVPMRATGYMQPRFVRAPEVMLAGKIGCPIDMWSFGCVVAEMANGAPLFVGCDEADQMASIMEVLGMPPRSVLEGGTRAHVFINSRGHPRYCSVTTSLDGEVELSGAPSRRGVFRGSPRLTRARSVPEGRRQSRFCGLYPSLPGMGLERADDPAAGPAPPLAQAATTNRIHRQRRKWNALNRQSKTETFGDRVTTHNRSQRFWK